MVVHSAALQDRDGAKITLDFLRHSLTTLRVLFADGGYAGALVSWVYGLRSRNKLSLQIVKRSDTAIGFRVLPKRWIVERTFGWLGRYRRLSKDYELYTETSEAMIHIAMINLMLRRLASC